MNLIREFYFNLQYSNKYSLEFRFYVACQSWHFTFFACMVFHTENVNNWFCQIVVIYPYLFSKQMLHSFKQLLLQLSPSPWVRSWMGNDGTIEHFENYQTAIFEKYYTLKVVHSSYPHVVEMKYISIFTYSIVKRQPIGHFKLNFSGITIFLFTKIAPLMNCPFLFWSFYGKPEYYSF